MPCPLLIAITTSFPTSIHIYVGLSLALATPLTTILLLLTGTLVGLCCICPNQLIVNQWLPIMLQLMLRLILTGKLISYLVFHHIAVCFDYSYFRDMFFHCPTFRSTNNASHVAYAFPSISQVIWIMSPVYPFCFNSMKISFNFTIIFFIWDSPCKLGVIW